MTNSKPADFLADRTNELVGELQILNRRFSLSTLCLTHPESEIRSGLRSEPADPACPRPVVVGLSGGGRLSWLSAGASYGYSIQATFDELALICSDLDDTVLVVRDGLDMFAAICELSFHEFSVWEEVL